MKLRTKIVATYIGVAGAGIALVSLITSWQIKSYFDGRIANTMGEDLDVVASLFRRGALAGDSTESGDAGLSEMARILGQRITVVRKDGVVVFDSEVPRDSLSLLENHSGRPEIVRARETGSGTDVRHSESVGVDFLYAARLVTRGTGTNQDTSYVRLAFPLREMAALDAQVQVIIWVIGIASILVFALVSYVVSSRVSGPILSLAGTAKAVTRGEVEQRSPIKTNDEIGDLANAINEMSEKLGSDIAELRKLERIRSEFLANVSHELRTPIFSIQGFLETLMDGAVDDPSVNREFLQKAHRHAERLNVLLNDLIEISRIESGEMKMSFRYFPVVEFAGKVVEEMRGAAEKKGLALRFVSEVDPGLEAYGDRDRLRQALENLIDNAVKYTDPGGTVTCRITTESGHCTISVEDTGCGIPEEHLPRIFERFYRVDRDRSREVGGTGLGLAIVKHIIEAHGGVVRARSTVGVGSTFAFDLKT